jgi:phosphoribosylglycinamide formyltransferase-1
MKIAILGSGRGSNAKALLTAHSNGELPGVEIILLLSDQPDAPFLKLGDEFGVPSRYISAGKYRTRLSDESEQEYVRQLNDAGVELVVLAGFMRVLKSTFLNAWSNRMINLHPSLLPSFPGLASIRQAWDYGVKVTGCTVHWVTAELDAGPIIDQEVVRIEKEDTLETLEYKVHAAEHRLLPRVVKLLQDTFNEWYPR